MNHNELHDCDINDKRNAAEFRGITFSKFQCSKVKKEFISCMADSKIESACYWGAELICAGHFSILWDCILLFISKYIHLGNPKLPIYIAMRFDAFKSILSNGYLDNEIRMRNNIKIRQIFAEIIGILCFSMKKHSFETIKIKKRDEFNMTHMATKLKAPSIQFAADIFKHDDPKELYIAINELAFHISASSKNVVSACYWLEWLIEYNIICKNKKEKCSCERRTFPTVLDKYQMDPIWLVWDVIIQECKKRNNPLPEKIIHALLSMFCIKYTSGVAKKRKYIIYFAIALLTEPCDMTREMITNKNKIQYIVEKINMVYKDVKKNEISPNTDYLFVGAEKSNLDKTIERLDKMKELTGM